MSLRSKIIFLFVGLAIVPILGVAVVGSRQAIGLATEALSVFMRAAADRAASEIGRELAELEARVQRLATAPPTVALAEGEIGLETWESAVGSDLLHLAHVEIVGPEGSLARWRTAPTEPARCREGLSSRTITLEQRLPSQTGAATLIATVWLDEVAPPSFRSENTAFALIHRDTGAILLGSDCASSGFHAEAAVPGLAVTALSGRATGFTGPDGRNWIGGLSTVSDRPWVALASIRSSMILGPLYNIQRSYWAFVLLLTLATGLAFSLMLGGVTRSLEQLTKAAEGIGEGEMNPWLPPPGRDEVGRLSYAFGKMLDRLRQMLQRVDQEGRLAVVGRLTSYLAHEIRNPLSSIRLNLQALRRDLRDRDPAEDALESVDICLREVDRLSDSVNRVLRLGTSSSEPHQPVAVHELVEDAARLLAENCERAGISVRLELDAEADRVVAAPGQLKGVFLNLFMNAIEAQPGGGEIVVRSCLRAVPGHGPVVAIHVGDRGRGVPPHLREKVFEPFFTTKDGGSGIGLAAAQRAMRENGGDLYLAEISEVVPGSNFVVELPLAPRASGETAPHRKALAEWMKSDPNAVLAASARPQEGFS